MTNCPACTTPFEPERRKLHLCPDCRTKREAKDASRRATRKAQKVAPLDCLRCSKKYTRQRSSKHFCEDCTKAVKREGDRARKRQRYAEAKQAAEELVRSGSEWAVGITDEWLDEAGLGTDSGDLAIALDRLPEGATTPAGPDEGRSSFYPDLRGDLDTLSRQAASVSWWRENPHWAYRLGEAVETYDLAPGLRCGDQRGRYAGYKRHKNAGEAACPECSAAKREYVATQR